MVSNSNPKKRGRQLNPEQEYLIINTIKDAGDDGLTYKQLIKRTGLPRTTIYDRTQHFIKQSYINLKAGTRPKLFRIAYKGNQYWRSLSNIGNVDQVEITIEKSDPKDGLIALQKFSVKYPVRQLPAIYWGGLHNHMKNWFQGISEWKGHVELVNGIDTEPGNTNTIVDKDGNAKDYTGDMTDASHVQINVKMIIGRNAHELEALAWDIVRKHAKFMEDVGGYELGLPEIVGEPEYEIASQIAKDEIAKYGWSKGVRDASVHGGEFIFSNPDEVQSFADLKDVLPGLAKAQLEATRELLTEMKDIRGELHEVNAQGKMNTSLIQELAKMNIEMAKILKPSDQPPSQDDDQEPDEPPASMYT